jgi:nucleotide-binding universal stress UspA family protein
MEGSQEMEFRRILVPVDGSSLSLKAAAAAARLAKQSGASITLLTAVEPPGAACAYVSEATLTELRRGLSQAAAEILKKAAAAVTGLPSPPDQQVVEASPTAAIVAEANRGYDLVVMGSRGLGLHASERDFLGSVAERVLQRVDCPVLVLPEHPAEA